MPYGTLGSERVNVIANHYVPVSEHSGSVPDGMYEMEGLRGRRETDWVRADKCFWQVIIIYDYFLTFFQNLVKMMEELSVATGIQVMWFYVSDTEK